MPSWKRPARLRRNRRILAGALLLSAAGVFLPLAAGPASRLLGSLPLFRAERIEIEGLLYLSPEEVRAHVPVREGENLFLIRPARVEEALRRHPRIEEARVTRTVGRLKVQVRERQTFLLVNAGTLLEVDATGAILSPLARGLVADRPVLSGVPFPTVKAGARVTTARLGDILRLVSHLEAPEVGLVADISEIVSEERTRAVLRTTRDQIPIYVDPQRVTRSGMRALSAALRDVRERNRRVLAVDARYRGQVVIRCLPEDSVSVAVSRMKV